MASIVDESGIQVEVEGEIVLTREQVLRLRDMIIVRLRDRVNLSFISIGEIIGLSRSQSAKRYKVVPPEARELYGHGELV